jgi:hypothetical protein
MIEKDVAAGCGLHTSERATELVGRGWFHMGRRWHEALTLSCVSALVEVEWKGNMIGRLVCKKSPMWGSGDEPEGFVGQDGYVEESMDGANAITQKNCSRDE